MEVLRTSRIFENIPEASRTFQKHSREFERILEDSRIFANAPEPNAHMRAAQVTSHHQNPKAHETAC
eukprot:6923389-Prorocentrum_lima.AAC.1